MIDSKDISVIAQGPVKDETLKCLTSIRKYLPHAQLILSTWEGTDVTKLEKYCDKILLNKDPGGYYCGFSTKNSNNRQIYSTQQGVNCADRKYILKIRSDSSMHNDNILRLHDTFKRTENLKVYSQRIFVNDIYTVKYETDGKSKGYRPFHVSDWWFFGLATDIKEMFNIPLCKEPDFSQYFAFHKPPAGKYSFFPQLFCQFTPEQYIQIQNVNKKYPEVKFEHWYDFNDTNIEQSEIFVVNNFIPLSKEQSGIYNEKEAYKRLRLESCRRYDPDGIYSEFVWLKDYKKYIDKDYQFNKLEKIRMLFKDTRAYWKFQENKSMVLAMLDQLYKDFVPKLCCTIYYAILATLNIFHILCKNEEK